VASGAAVTLHDHSRRVCGRLSIGPRSLDQRPTPFRRRTSGQLCIRGTRGTVSCSLRHARCGVVRTRAVVPEPRRKSLRRHLQRNALRASRGLALAGGVTAIETIALGWLLPGAVIICSRRSDGKAQDEEATTPKRHLSPMWAIRRGHAGRGAAGALPGGHLPQGRALSGVLAPAGPRACQLKIHTVTGVGEKTGLLQVTLAHSPRGSMRGAG
jgi:hypothetical protein